MVRPKKDEKLVPFTVMLTPKHVEEIKNIAEKGELTAGKLARNCLLIGLDEARAMNRLGIVGLIGSSRKALDEIKKKFNLDSNFEIAKDESSNNINWG